MAYQRFKDVQLTQNEDLEAFKTAKTALRQRLFKLDNLLNRQMYKNITDKDVDEQGMFANADFQEWHTSHQPFHWIAEFYDIMQGNGGFDVIIGNPPYVSMSKINYLSNSAEFSCSDLYGHVIQRVLSILHKQGTHGFIVMHNLAFSANFHDVRKLLLKYEGNKWFSFFGRIPAGLFAGDVRVRNCIYILNPMGKHTYTTRLHRWFPEQRDSLMQIQKYCECIIKDSIPMLYSSILQSLYEDNQSHTGFLDRMNGETLYFNQSAYNWLSVSPNEAPIYDKHDHRIPRDTIGKLKVKKDWSKMILLFLCGKITYTKWLTYGDEFHLTIENLQSFPFPFERLSPKDCAILNDLGDEFIKKLPETIQFKLNAGKKVGAFNTSKLWYITDKSDAIFLRYLTDNPEMMREEIENFLACSVITGKKQ